jgi:hypothetical protein
MSKDMLCKIGNLIMKSWKLRKLFQKLHMSLTAYNKLLRHILRLKGCEVDAVSLYWS